MRIMLDTNAYSGFKRGEGEIIVTPYRLRNRYILF